MVASGSLVWCWRDGRWVPLRLSSIKLSGAVTKAHWDAVNEFLSLAASQRLVLQEGSLSLEQKKDLISQQKRLNELQKKLNFVNESDVVVDSNNDESLKTCGEFNSEKTDRVANFDVLTWLENNRLSLEPEESKSTDIVPVKSMTVEPQYQNQNQSIVLKNFLLVDDNDKKVDAVNEDLKTGEDSSSRLIYPDNSPFIGLSVVRCLKDDNDNKKLLVLSDNNLNPLVRSLSIDDNKISDDKNENQILPRINILNYLQLIEQNGDKKLDDDDSSLRWQKLVVSTKQNNKYNLDDDGKKNEMTSLILKPLQPPFPADKPAENDEDGDISISPLQRHLCRPIKHKQPCRQPHKCEDKHFHGRKYPLNRNNTHPLDNLFKKEYSEFEIEQIPRVNSLSQTRLEWHQLIQDDKEAAKEESKTNNKTSFSKVSISVLNLQRFSRLVRQRKNNCDNNGLGDDKKNKSKKGSQKSKTLKRSDSSSENKKDVKNEGGFRSLRNRKNVLNDSIDNYADVPKDKINSALQWQRLVQRHRERKGIEDIARYSEGPTSNKKGIRIDEQERYSDEPHKENELAPSFSNWLQKCRALPDKLSGVNDEQERYSDEPSQWQQAILKQHGTQVAEKKLRRQREAWARNTRKLSEGHRPFVSQE